MAQYIGAENACLECLIGHIFGENMGKYGEFKNKPLSLSVSEFKDTEVTISVDEIIDLCIFYGIKKQDYVQMLFSYNELRDYLISKSDFLENYGEYSFKAKITKEMLNVGLNKKSLTIDELRSLLGEKLSNGERPKTLVKMI